MTDTLYLIASLPYLDFQQDVSEIYSSMDGFYEDCEVLGETFANVVIKAVKNSRESSLQLAKEWSCYEYSIKNEIAKKRWPTIRKGTYNSIYINNEVPVSAEALDIVGIINQEQNALLREQAILKYKWQILDAFEPQYQFALENIVIYGWKLQLYYSYRSLTEKRGKNQWNSLVKTLADKSGFSISTITGGF